MSGGFDGSSLAVFTGLTPAGTVAFTCLAAFLLVGIFREEGPRAGWDGRSLWGHPDERAAALANLRHLMAIPLAIAWAGLVAAATHLGTPANALYAFSAVGASPLSSEVTATVVFLFLSGVYWLYGFARVPRRGVEALLLTLGVVSAGALLFRTAVAYSVSTVPSWDSWLASVSVVAGAAVAGPSLAMLVLSISFGVRGLPARVGWAMIFVSLACLVANVAVLGGYADYLAGLSNNVVAVGSLAAPYKVTVPLYGLLTIAGLALQAFSLRRRDSGRHVICALGCLVTLAAAVLVRFPFYEAYLSVGF